MRILIVEDEPKIAHAIKKGLSQEGYAADTIANGKQGQLFALSGDYDLVILDRMLPDIDDGLTICRAMRERKMSTPVLVLTAKDHVRQRVEGLEGGADDYLIKPFAFDELLARVRALLRRPSETLPAILTVGDLELDTVQLTVHRAGQRIDLSAKEFALLDYMMRNPNRTLTKDMLISHVWDYDADILPNTVEVYIGYLRQKIDRPFSKKPLLHTIRGFGYRLSETGRV